MVSKFLLCPHFYTQRIFQFNLLFLLSLNRLSDVLIEIMLINLFHLFKEFYVPDLAPVNPVLEKVKILQKQQEELYRLQAKVSELTSGYMPDCISDLAQTVTSSTKRSISKTSNVADLVPSNNQTLDAVNSEVSDHTSCGDLLETSNIADVVLSDNQALDIVNSEISDDLSADGYFQVERSVIALSDNESPSCFYVPMTSNVSAQNIPTDNYSVNSQPDLLEDLLSFVGESSPVCDVKCPVNLPDLDDLAIDSNESSASSPGAVSPTPT